MASIRLSQRLAPALGLLLACGGGDLVLPADGVPIAIAVMSGGGQGGRVGAPLANPLVARVADAQDRPVADVRVAFAFADPAADGSVVPDTATTDADGLATFRVVMGSRVGRVAGELRVAGSPGITVPVSFTAVSADANEIHAVAGDGQNGPAGTVLPEPLVVQVTDAFGNPISGAPISWSVDGGGAVSDEATQTGADGLASVVRTLGGAAGEQHALASSPGLAGSPVTFTHVASAGAATVLEAVSGGGQSAVVGTALPEPLAVRARDEAGNPVPGLAVTWVVGDGGGSLTPQTSLTDEDGLAFTRWTLGQAPGANGATAVVSGVGTVGFAATAVPGTPPGLTLETGPPTSAVRGVALSPAPMVQLREPDGGPRRLAGVAVRVSVVEGGATLGGTAVRATDANGRAEFRDLALLGTPAAYTLGFSATGYTGVTSPAITLRRASTAIAIRSDDPDPSIVGAPVQVRFRVESPGGTPTGQVRVVSDDGAACTASVAQGECTLTFVVAGGRILTATYAGDTQFEGSATTASHQVDAPVPPVLALVTQPSGTATAGQPFGRQPVVQLRDAAGATLATAGVSVTVAVAGGAGTLAGIATQVTGQDGRATFTGLALNGAAGSYTLRFTADGYTPVISEAIALAPAGPVATTTTITADDPDPSDVGQAVTVRFGVAASTGTPTGTVTVAASASESCSATVGAGECLVTLTQPGIRTLTASYSGDAAFAASTATATHTVRTPPAVPSATTSSVEPRDATLALGRATEVVVTVRDASGGELEGIVVILSATGTGNLITPGSATTDKKGEAKFAFSATDAGARTLTAVAGGVTIAQQPSVTVAPAPTQTRITSDAPDPSAPGAAVTVAFTVSSDGGTPGGDVTVSSSGGGSCTAAVATGRCDLVPAGTGGVTFTATYAGVGNFGPSSDTESHTVVAPATSTSIVSDTPDPSEVGQAVTVQFQVTSSAGTPTGTVTVSSSGGESCSAGVAQGSCEITFSSGGQRTITASYPGDGTFAPSSDTESHTVNAPNAPPNGVADAFSGIEDQALVVNPRGVLNNDSDPNGGALQALADTPPAHGQLQLASDGGFRYVPAADFAGEDGFTYRVSDGTLSSGAVAVRVTVEPVNDPPDFTAGPGQSVAANSGPQSVAGWATDIRPGPADESGQQVSFEVDVALGGFVFSTQPAVSPDGTLTYTPSGLPGTAIVTVVAHDNGGRSGAGNDTSSARTFIILVTPL